MALGLGDYASVAALVSAFCDVVSFGRESFEAAYQRYLSAPDAGQRAAILQSSYSDEEIDSIRDRILHCRKLFVETGDGNARRRCLCFTLKNAKLGDGGFPFPEWEETYRRLNCA